MVYYLPVWKGSSDIQQWGKTKCLTWKSLARVMAGSKNSISKHMNMPKLTPKSVSRTWRSGVEGFVTGSPYGLNFLYLPILYFVARWLDLNYIIINTWYLFILFFLLSFIGQRLNLGKDLDLQANRNVVFIRMCYESEKNCLVL